MSHNYNPDVLTLPLLAGQMLDLLPAELWRNKKATFLDPGCKSGMFMREIANRLDAGLERQIPDRQHRDNHICMNQLYSLAIMELTSLLSHRSVYCSKTANGKYSVCEIFDAPEGNIRFERIVHAWVKGRCSSTTPTSSPSPRHAGHAAHPGAPARRWCEYGGVGVLSTDNGSEYGGSECSERQMGFHAKVERCGVSYRFLPPATPNAHADVESSRAIVEHELFDLEIFRNRPEFSANVRAY